MFYCWSWHKRGICFIAGVGVKEEFLLNVGAGVKEEFVFNAGAGVKEEFVFIARAGVKEQFVFIAGAGVKRNLFLLLELASQQPLSFFVLLPYCWRMTRRQPDTLAASKAMFTRSCKYTQLKSKETCLKFGLSLD